MYKKKLIETSIPLDDINAQAVREKSIRKGHPSTLHLWWARRPLAAARCVIFASMVDDPSEHPEMFRTEEEQDRERERLFGIIRRLADWDNIGDEALYDEARAEMKKYAPNGELPEFLDPFAGGGALPLEAQRLGLVSHAADLNPIPVTINRAMIDIPARFCGNDPVNPEARRSGMSGTWPRATGLANDVEHYANLMREKAKERIGQNYPDVEVTKSGVTKKATPIAYIWARTVTCPNPACRHETPLVRSFWLSKKRGHRAYIEPIAEGGKMRYEVHCEGDGKPADFDHVHDGTVGRRGAVCLHCGAPISLDYVRAESIEHGLGSQLMAIVCESPFGQGRWYSAATLEDARDADIEAPLDSPHGKALGKAKVNVGAYGLTDFRQLFTNRQLVALTTFSDLVIEVKDVIESDAREAGMNAWGVRLKDDGTGAKAYAEAISVYLAFVVDKLVDRCSALCSWDSSPRQLSIRNVFGRQAIAMTWDYAETNPLSSSTGSFESMLSQVSGAIGTLPAKPHCDVVQRDASQKIDATDILVSTDPPYYDNIDYADLSDFFYIWLRRSLKDVWPQTFGTLQTPKAEELVATPYRFQGGSKEAKSFFEHGMRITFQRLEKAMSNSYPMTVYYAYKQSESTQDGRTSSGWETMLQALIDAGLQITGTWPMRTEMANRNIASGANALASSIVLVCRRRANAAPIASRAEFLRDLRKALREGLSDMQSGSIAPVDLAQAAIGPGMAAFSKYSEVLEADGTPMSVHVALGIINEQLDALMGESGEDLDGETRFCITWYAEHGFDEGPFGDAQVLQNARGASLEALSHAGVLASGGGKVRLVRPTEVADLAQARLAPSCWSDLMAEIGALESRDGVAAAARAASEFDDARAERTKSLAYLLFQSAERAGRGEDAQLFNDLVTSWGDITERAEDMRRHRPVQERLDFGLGPAMDA
jgi:putative DNA methylase